MDEAMKILLERLKDNGIATASVKDGRILVISREKLQELFAVVSEKAEKYITLFIKDPTTVS